MCSNNNVTTLYSGSFCTKEKWVQFTSPEMSNKKHVSVWTTSVWDSSLFVTTWTYFFCKFLSNIYKREEKQRKTSVSEILPIEAQGPPHRIRRCFIITRWVTFAVGGRINVSGPTTFRYSTQLYLYLYLPSLNHLNTVSHTRVITPRHHTQCFRAFLPQS